MDELTGAGISTDENLKGDVDASCMKSKVGIAVYQPGNMGRYELIFGYSPALNPEHPRNFFCAWMHKGGSGGNIIKTMEGSYTHYTYVQEKLSLHSYEDARTIAHFMNVLNCNNYEPIQGDLPRGHEQTERSGDQNG